MAKLRGTGMAAVNYPTGMNLGGDPSQALIHATTSGSFNVVLAATDLGQGLKTVVAQIAAETLGVPYEEIVVQTADTDTGPHDMGTFASRGTHRVGNAVKVAAAEALELILQLASEELEVAVRDLELDGKGSVRVVGSPDKSLGIADLASRAQFQYGRTIAGRGIWMKPKSGVDPDTGAMDPDSTQAYACTVAEVEVDTETGIVTVLRIRSAYEVGRQMNPALVQGQILGGAWMAVSHALYETTEPYYPVRDHRPHDFGEYLMPGPADMPEVESVVLEVPSVERAVRREGRRRDDRQLADPGDRQRDPRRVRRPDRHPARHARGDPPGPRRESSRGGIGMSQITSWDEFPTVEYVKGVHRQTVSGEKVMMTRIVYRDGVVIPEHSHEAEQIMLLVSGRLWAKVADEEKEVGPGDLLIIPSNWIHAFRQLGDEDVVFYEAFAPIRLEYLVGFKGPDPSLGMMHASFDATGETDRKV